MQYLTTVEAIITSSNIDDREFSVQLLMKNISFDKSQTDYILTVYVNYNLRIVT
jgi:hypothetical protein